MQVRTVGFALLISETMPARFIKFGEMGLVLGVEYFDRPASSNDDVRHEVAKGAMSWI